MVNFAAHLEKNATQAGYVSLSQRVCLECSPRVLSIFEGAGDFEGRRYRTSVQRFDALFDCVPGCAEVAVS